MTGQLRGTTSSPRELRESMTDSIEIKGIELRGLHGAFRDERQLGQRFIVDVTLWTDLSSAGFSDRLEDTIDYTGVCRTVVEVSRMTSCQLMEHLAAKIAEAILDNWPLGAVTVAVSKKPRGVSGMPREVTIRLTREREA